MLNTILTFFKSKAAPIMISILAVFAPIKGMIVTVGILVLADMIFGAWAAKKRGEKITSAGLRRTVSKTVIYMSAVMLSYLTEKYLMADALPASKVVAGLIGAVELKSIIESLDEVNGTSTFASLVKTLGSKNDETKS